MASKAPAPGAAAGGTEKFKTRAWEQETSTWHRRPHWPNHCNCALLLHTAAVDAAKPSSSSSTSSSAAKSRSPLWRTTSWFANLSLALSRAWSTAPTPLLLTAAAAVQPLTNTEEPSTANNYCNVKQTKRTTQWPLHLLIARPARQHQKHAMTVDSPGSTTRGSARPARPTIEQVHYQQPTQAHQRRKRTALDGPSAEGSTHAFPVVWSLFTPCSGDKAAQKLPAAQLTQAGNQPPTPITPQSSVAQMVRALGC